ncbi:hypothetical protein Tco_0466224 [Tanacetum coccineum]
MSSWVTNKVVHIARKPRNQKPFLKSKDLACPTCKKCIYSANHDVCILKYLSKVNSRASAHKKDAQSHKIAKRYIPVEKKRDSENHGRIFTYVGLRWIPIRKTVENCNNTNDSVLPLGKETCTHDTVICATYSSLSAGRSLRNQRYKRRCCSFIPAESDSQPRAHTQATKTTISIKIQESRKLKFKQRQILLQL